MLGADDVRTTRREHVIDDRIVVLRVGSDFPQEFAVHEIILKRDSPFFRSALDKKWREGRSRSIDLPQDDSAIIGAYVHWLYFKDIASKPIAPPDLPVDDGEYDFLARMYVFGEKIQSDCFCDTVVDAMTLKTDDIASDGTRTFPSYSTIMLLYSGTPPRSPARLFLVAMYADFGGEKWSPEEAELSHPEFLADLVRAFFGKKRPALVHKQVNWPRRHKWHKRPQTNEFLQPAASRESLRIDDAE